MQVQFWTPDCTSIMAVQAVEIRQFMIDEQLHFRQYNSQIEKVKSANGPRSEVSLPRQRNATQISKPTLLHCIECIVCRVF